MDAQHDRRDLVDLVKHGVRPDASADERHRWHTSRNDLVDLMRHTPHATEYGAMLAQLAAADSFPASDPAFMKQFDAFCAELQLEPSPHSASEDAFLGSLRNATELLHSETLRGTRATIVSAVAGAVISVITAIAIAAWFGRSTDSILRNIQDENATTHKRVEQFRSQQTGLMMAILRQTRSQAYVSAVGLLSGKISENGWYENKPAFFEALRRTVFRKCPQLTKEETLELAGIFCREPISDVELTQVRQLHAVTMGNATRDLEARKADTFTLEEQALAHFIPGDYAAQYANACLCSDCTSKSACPACQPAKKSELLKRLNTELEALGKASTNWP